MRQLLIAHGLALAIFASVGAPAYGPLRPSGFGRLPQPSGAQLPLWIMSEARFDQKYGFDCKISIFPAARG
jgi:hypothetical protein